MKKLLLAFKLLRRNAKSGEAKVLLVALFIAVTSVTTVSFFADRVESALNTFVAGSVSASSSGLTDNNPAETEFVPTLGAEVEIRELVEIGYSRAGAEKILEDARAMPAYVTRFD